MFNHTNYFRTFDEAYHSALMHLTSFGEAISPRGMKCYEILNYGFSLMNPYLNKINWIGVTSRQEVYEKYLDEEHQWYKSGNLKAESAPSKFWLKLADEDGNITSNYGHMVFFDKKIETLDGLITSFDYVTRLLSTDPDSRQAIIHYGHPGHFWEGNKDYPCTTSQQFFIRNNMLFCITTMRSQDVWRGSCYDIPWFTYVQECVRREISRLLGREIGMGTYSHNVGSFHLYESNLKDAEIEAAAWGKKCDEEFQKCLDALNELPSR